MTIRKSIHKMISSLHYSDIEPFLLWTGIILFLASEYLVSYIPLFEKCDFTPLFAVAVLKLLLTKMDKLSGNQDDNVGYLGVVVDTCMKKKIKCNKLRIFSFDSQGFYHAIMGKDFYAEEIVVLMHKNAYAGNEEILKRWKLLEEKQKTRKVVLKFHEYDRFAFGMTFDNKSGVFGTFKPKCIVNQQGIASTLNTYYCVANKSEADRQAIMDFNDIFDEIDKSISSQAI